MKKIMAVDPSFALVVHVRSKLAALSRLSGNQLRGRCASSVITNCSCYVLFHSELLHSWMLIYLVARPRATFEEHDVISCILRREDVWQHS